MLITLASAKGAPGVSTTAIALAIHWPRPVVILEADLSGSSIIPGYLRGQIKHDRGVPRLTIAHNNGHLADELPTQTLPLDPRRPADGPLLIPGLFDAGTATAAKDLWGPLASHLASQKDHDTIVDLGRLDAVSDHRDAFIRLADLSLLASTSRLPDILATRHLVRRREAKTTEGARAFTNLRSLTIGPGKPYTAKEVAETVELRAVEPVGWDPKYASAFSDGVSRAPREYSKSEFSRSIDKLAADVSRQVRERELQLRPRKVRS
ncbi:hypothetical protein [Promicromonospora sp. NFX87]|uniref:hypothetical protein n=1 Tax=Promicromonospora sp. NFX87 TaxID=3402691 RepID=UPI003AFB7E1C